MSETQIQYFIPENLIKAAANPRRPQCHKQPIEI